MDCIWCGGSENWVHQIATLVFAGKWNNWWLKRTWVSKSVLLCQGKMNCWHLFTYRMQRQPPPHYWKFGLYQLQCLLVYIPGLFVMMPCVALQITYVGRHGIVSTIIFLRPCGFLSCGIYMWYNVYLLLLMGYYGKLLWDYFSGRQQCRGCL